VLPSYRAAAFAVANPGDDQETSAVSTAFVRLVTFAVASFSGNSVASEFGDVWAA
jgi:hypothetical protein